MKNPNPKTVNMDTLISDIQNFLEEKSSETGEKQFYTQELILQLIIWGSINTYEGIGILEECKSQWKEMCQEISE